MPSHYQQPQPGRSVTDIIQELSVLNGDGVTCSDLLEIPKAAPSKGRYETAEQVSQIPSPHLSGADISIVNKMYEYGAREGVPRLLNLFKK